MKAGDEVRAFPEKLSHHDRQGIFYEKSNGWR
jgi:hypothetical protein